MVEIIRQLCKLSPSRSRCVVRVSQWQDTKNKDPFARLPPPSPFVFLFLHWLLITRFAQLNISQLIRCVKYSSQWWNSFWTCAPHHPYSLVLVMIDTLIWEPFFPQTYRSLCGEAREVKMLLPFVRICGADGEKVKRSVTGRLRYALVDTLNGEPNWTVIWRKVYLWEGEEEKKKKGYRAREINLMENITSPIHAYV